MAIGKLYRLVVTRGGKKRVVSYHFGMIQARNALVALISRLGKVHPITIERVGV